MPITSTATTAETMIQSRCDLIMLSFPVGGSSAPGVLLLSIYRDGLGYAPESFLPELALT
jgi:hypothetical protein